MMNKNMRQRLTTPLFAKETVNLRRRANRIMRFDNTMYWPQNCVVRKLTYAHIWCNNLQIILVEHEDT